MPNGNTQVLLLADTPAEQNEEVVQATAALVTAAKDERLVAVVCKHMETGKLATMLCAMFVDDSDAEGSAQYVPLAMLFTKDNAPWAAYAPPESAMAKSPNSTGPLDLFDNDDSREPDNGS